MEHGWVSRPARQEEAEPARRRFHLSEWLPAALAARGGRPNRETERALADIRAVQYAREQGWTR